MDSLKIAEKGKAQGDGKKKGVEKADAIGKEQAVGKQQIASSAPRVRNTMHKSTMDKSTSDSSIDSITPEIVNPSSIFPTNEAISKKLLDGTARVITPPIQLVNTNSSLETYLIAGGDSTNLVVSEDYLKAFQKSMIAEVKVTMENNNKSLLKRISRLSAKQTMPIQDASSLVNASSALANALTAGKSQTMDLSLKLPIDMAHEIELPCKTIADFANFCKRLEAKDFFQYHVSF